MANSLKNADAMIPNDDGLGLITDLYELTMAAGYFCQGLHTRRASFEAFVRSMPPHRNYLIAAGLEQVVQYLTHLRFTEPQVRWLAGLPSFRGVPTEFFDYLRRLHFSGDLDTMLEGTVFFPGEPVLRITGDLLQVQLAETYVETCIAAQTIVASKAVRIVQAAQGRPVLEFGMRRAYGPQAGLLAARAAMIAGCAGTSNVEAARRLCVPAVGTQAHSWIMSFEEEQEAFLRYAEIFGPHTICLIDTYDTLAGARKATAVGANLKGVRLDSGDLLSLSREVRAILDDAGLRQTKIVASGDLNEYRIAELLECGAPIDVFGVGTELVTSPDAPNLSIVYKLVELADDRGEMRPRCKTSEGKTTLGRAKQVWRRYREGTAIGDMLTCAAEQAEGTPLIEPLIRGGNVIRELPTMPMINDRVKKELDTLPANIRSLTASTTYPVEISDRLRAGQPH